MSDNSNDVFTEDIRLIAKFDEKTNGKCIICEKEALCRWVYFSKAY